MTHITSMLKTEDLYERIMDVVIEAPDHEGLQRGTVLIKAGEPMAIDLDFELVRTGDSFKLIYHRITMNKCCTDDFSGIAAIVQRCIWIKVRECFNPMDTDYNASTQHGFDGYHIHSPGYAAAAHGRSGSYPRTSFDQRREEIGRRR